MENKKRIRIIAYIAMYVALYVVLKWVGNLIPFLQMPNGGSIELELIAVFIASYHLGWKWGAVVAIVSWLITWILGFPMWFASAMSGLLDYVLPLLVCGMASALWPIRDMGRTGSACMAALLAVASFLGIYFSWSRTVLAAVAGAVIAIGMFVFANWHLRTKKKFGIVIAMLLKYVSQLLAGVYFWFPEGTAAGSAAAWTYSAGYNLWYNLVTMIVCMFVVPMLIERLENSGVKFKA